ncbi:MAG: hypothetical protein KAT15_20045 [Bacteroidales bacterium]|nr:hypothetical protein [Bacteroidales bacterium]
MKGKIIGIGFQKTGTSSLREALKILGYRVKDTSARPLIPILKGDYNRVLRMIRDYDALEDTPWYMIYKELDERIPGSKFILTQRDEESWYKSVSRHIGVLRNASHEWIYGRGKGLPMEHKENTIRVYTNHNHDVLEYFKDRPGDLLVVDFTRGDGWKQLCAFLGKEIPDHPFPHYNQWQKKQSKQTYYGHKKNLKFYRKSLRNHIKIKYIDLRKYW